MSDAWYQFVSQDLPAMLTGTFAVLACGVLGNFLLLRRLALLGDAISHSVLPGLVGGFLLAGSRGRLPMFAGAAGAGLAAVVLVELVRRLARLESGAAMGVVFTVFFALGVVLIERAHARGVDLDPDCVLHGMLEAVFWFPPRQWDQLLSPATLALVPRELWTTGAVAGIAALFVTLFFKELRVATFDPELATALGFNARTLHLVLMLLVAAAVVAAFEAVGAILVVAMLVCPPAIARLLTDRLAAQVWMSALVSVVIGVGGYALAGWVMPRILNGPDLNAAGMMATLAGVLLLAALLFSPRYGWLTRRWHTRCPVRPPA